MNRLMGLILACWPVLALADPLDIDEGYTTRQLPASWLDKSNFWLLLGDYAIFALVVVGFGWLLLKQPRYLAQAESIIQRPFRSLFTAAGIASGVMKGVLYLLGGLATFAALALWIFFCQWLKAQGLGAFSMAGLALMSVMLVRLIRGEQHAHKDS